MCMVQPPKQGTACGGVGVPGTCAAPGVGGLREKNACRCRWSAPTGASQKLECAPLLFNPYRNPASNYYPPSGHLNTAPTHAVRGSMGGGWCLSQEREREPCHPQKKKKTRDPAGRAPARAEHLPGGVTVACRAATIGLPNHPGPHALKDRAPESGGGEGEGRGDSGLESEQHDTNTPIRFSLT